jgi:endonuclease/exonuclease/phosphatase family metal-dependent hydrolase
VHVSPRLPILPWIVLALAWAGTALLDAAPIRVATFNIRNGLNDNQTDPQLEYDATKAVLVRIDADFIAFQELQSASLTQWRNLATELGYNFSHMAVTNGTRAGHLYHGYYSRFPVQHTNVNTPESALEWSRVPLRTTITVPGAAKPLVVWNMHHKSGRLLGDQFRRAIESLRIVQDIDAYRAIHPHHDEFLLVGDLNDDYRSTTQTNFFYEQPSGLVSSYRLGSDVTFPVAYHRFPDDRYMPAGGGLHRLPAFQQGGTNANTFRTGGAIDYILASTTLRDSPLGEPQAEVYNSAQDVATGGAGLVKIGAIPVASTSTNASDHYAVFADLHMADAPPPLFTVSSDGDFSPVGTGGGFNTTQHTYTIANGKETALDWFVAESAAWLDVHPAEGVTDVDGEVAVTVSLNARAAALPPGDYETELLFTDRETGSGVIRPVALRIMLVGIVVDTPGATLSTAAESFTYSGSMSGNLVNGLTWSNRANGLTGTVAYAARWSVDIPLAPGTNNVVDFRAAYAVTNAPVVRAADSPTDPAYADWWFPDSNGGQGFEPWQLRRDRGWAGYALFGPDVFNVPPSFGGAFSLWAMGDGVTTARRDFDQALTTGDTFHLQFDNNWIEGGKSVGFALTDSAGTKRLDFYFVGGETFYRVDDAEGSRVTGLTYTDQGLELAVQLVGEDGYRLTAGNNVIATGTLSPGGPVSAMVAANNGSGAGTAFDFYLGAMRIEDSSGIRASDGPADPAYAGGWTDGSRGGAGFGPWMINAVSLVGGDAGHARFSTDVWNVPPSFGGVFALWAHGNGYSEARRGFIQAMEIGEAFVLQFDNNLIEEGKLVGFSLADAAGVDRFKFLCYGGQQVYWVEDSGDPRATALPVAPNGLELRFELTGENSYRLSAGSFAAEGVLAGGGPLTQLRAFNYGSGVGTAYDFYLGALRLETPSIDTLEVNATSLQVWREPDPADFTEGLPNAWWLQYFGTTDGVSGADDSDGDGFTNAQEYALGTDPADPASAFRTHAPVLADGQVSITWDAVEGKTYRVVGTSDFSAELWPQVGETVTAPATGPQTVTHATDAPRHFYRVELVP